MKIKLMAIASLLLLCWLGGGCASSRDFGARLSSIVKPYRFSIAKWESVAIPREVNQWIFSRYEKSDDEISVVAEYFSFIERIKTLKSEMQAINAGTRQGDSAPLEARVDKLGVSSLVVELGGLSTYPSIITDEANLQYVIDSATDEWVHHYLVFTPLGFQGLPDIIGVSPYYEIATINETLGSMVSNEIGSIVREKYYPEYGNDGNQTAESEFDFNREMREIRKTVDKYLARGEIEQAEEFMEQKRQYLSSMGHYIRKLNQAYFAFHGAYADR